MEELLLAEGLKLFVQPIAKGRVALLDGARDGVHRAELRDARDELVLVLALPGEGQGLGVVGDPHVPAAVGERVVDVGVLVVLGGLPIGVLRLNVGVRSGSLDHQDLLAAELALGRDRGVFAGDGAERDLHVGLCEIDLLRALRRDREIGQDDVDLAGGQVLDSRIRHDGNKLELDAQILRDPLGVFDVVADVRAIRIGVPEGRLVAENADADRACRLDLLGRPGAHGLDGGSAGPLRPFRGSARGVVRRILRRQAPNAEVSQNEDEDGDQRQAGGLQPFARAGRSLGHQLVDVARPLFGRAFLDRFEILAV